MSMEFYAPTLDRAIYLALHKLRLFGSGEKRLLEHLVREGQHVLDIGANVGYYTCILAKCVTASGQVTAFEPMPQMQEALRCVVERNGLTWVTVCPVALSDTDGEVEMAARSCNSGDFRVHVGGEWRVPVRRGDGIIKTGQVDFIKIDVQGYEVPVLNGIRQILERSHTVKILFEYWPKGLEMAGYSPAAMVACLEVHGFDLYRILNPARLVRIPWAEIDRHCQPRPWGACANFVATRGAGDTILFKMGKEIHE